MLMITNIADGAAMNQQVDRAEPFASLVYEPPYLIRLGDIARQAHGPAAECLDSRNRLLGIAGSRGIADCDLGSFSGQAQSGRMPDSPRSPSDKRNSVLKCQGRMASLG